VGKVTWICDDDLVSRTDFRRALIRAFVSMYGEYYPGFQELLYEILYV